MADKCFILEGKEVSIDYYCVKDDPDIKKLVRTNYKRNPYRNYVNFKNWLGKKYTGDLPKNPVLLAKYFGYPAFVVDLFNMSESEYRVKHPKELKDFFENLPREEQVVRFQSADGGSRSVYEYEQDVISGNLFELMLVHHSKIDGVSVFRVNEEASSFTVTNTKADLKYEISVNGEDISIPVEVKTRYNHTIEDKDLVAKMRGNAKKLREEKGMIFSIFLNTEEYKSNLIDTVGAYYIPNMEFSGTKKKCDLYPIKREELFDCKFWKEDDMKKLLDMIYTKYKNRK